MSRVISYGPCSITNLATGVQEPIKTFPRLEFTEPHNPYAEALTFIQGAAGHVIVRLAEGGPGACIEKTLSPSDVRTLVGWLSRMESDNSK